MAQACDGHPFLEPLDFPHGLALCELCLGSRALEPGLLRAGGFYGGLDAGDQPAAACAARVGLLPLARLLPCPPGMWCLVAQSTAG